LAYSKTLCFTLKEEKGRYSLGAAVSVRQKVLRQQGGRHLNFVIPEESRTQIFNLSGQFRGKALPADGISYSYPQIQGTFTPPSKVYEVNSPREAKAGDELVCDYAVSYEDPVYCPLVRIPALNKVDRFTVVVNHPQDVKAEFEVYSPGGSLHPLIEQKPGMSSLVFQNLPAPSLLPENPFSDTHALIQIKLRKDDKAITAHTREAFCRWFREQVESTSGPSASMKELLGAELAAAATPRAKAKLLFDFVKTQIRYIGDQGEGHAFIPHAAADVFAKKWGDCKDKAWLLSVLAAQHGITIHPVLVSTEFMPEFSDLNLGLFNHVICVLEDQGQMVFMDPTATYSELGDLPDADLLGKGFVLDPANPRWVEIINEQATPSVEIQLKANIDDLKHGKAKILLRHTWRSNARRAHKELKALALENQLSNGLNRLLAKISIDHFTLLPGDTDALAFEAEADLSEFLIRTDLRNYIPTAPFRVLSRDLLERNADTLPIDAHGPDHYLLRVQLECAGLKIKPESIDLGTSGSAHFDASHSAGEGFVSLEYKYQQPFRIVPRGEREGLLNFCAQYLQLNRKPFILQGTPR